MGMIRWERTDGNQGAQKWWSISPDTLIGGGPVEIAGGLRGPSLLLAVLLAALTGANQSYARAYHAERSTPLEVCATCAFTTIEGAIEQANDNTTIMVYSGIYAGVPINVTRQIVLWAVDTVTVTGSVPWLSIYSTNFTTVGFFVLNNSAISIEQGATWYQQGNVTISHDQYVTGLASAGCIGVRGGSWVQDGDIIITVQSNGVMVTGKTTHWLQRGAVSVLVPNTATAIAQTIVLSSTDCTWIQEGPLTFSIMRGVGMWIGNLAGSTTTWTQTGKVTVNINSAFTKDEEQRGIILYAPMNTTTTWYQLGAVHVNISATNSSTVYGIGYVSTGGKTVWLQQGNVSVYTIASDAVRVIAISLASQFEFYPQGLWNQTGVVTIDMASMDNASVNAVTFGSLTPSTSTWNQYGDVNITVTASAINGSSPSIGVQGVAACGAWYSHGRIAISTIDSCGGCGSVRPIAISGSGCAFSFDHSVQLSGSGYNVVSCDDTYPIHYYTYIHGLPLGTSVLGQCNATFLPVINIDTASTSPTLKWGQPLIVQAIASAAIDIAYDVPFALNSGTFDLSVNASYFHFAPGRLTSTIEVLMIGRSPNASTATIDLIASDSALLGIGTAVEFAVSPSVLVLSNASSSIGYVVEIDLYSPDFSIIPKDGDALSTNNVVAIGFSYVYETAPTGEIVQDATIDQGIWSTDAETILGASEEFVFSGRLFNGTTIIEIRLSLYDREANGSSAGVTFTINPTMAKMSVHILNWPWLSPNNTLSMSLPIGPPFASVAQKDDSPQVGTTTYILQGQYDGQTQTTVHVLSAAEAEDGRTIPVATLVDSRTSTLTLRFPFFGANLTYDPDFGVVLTGNPDSGSDNTLVIAAAVAIPTAVVIVVSVIAIALAAAWLKRKRMRRLVGLSVNFGRNDDANSPHEGVL